MKGCKLLHNCKKNSINIYTPYRNIKLLRDSDSSSWNIANIKVQYITRTTFTPFEVFSKNVNYTNHQSITRWVFVKLFLIT